MNVWEIHPMLVHFPIALLLSAIAVDVFAWWRPNDTLNRIATGLLIAGTGAGWLAANFGLLAFYTVPAHTHEAHHLMFWHIGAALTTLVLCSWLSVVRWLHRMKPITRGKRIVGLLAAGTLLTTGGLGGYLVYHGGAGVEPQLLAESVREAHSHANGAADAAGGHQDHQQIESYQSAYGPASEGGGHAGHKQRGDGKAQDNKGQKKAAEHQRHQPKANSKHADHGQKAESENTKHEKHRSSEKSHNGKHAAPEKDESTSAEDQDEASSGKHHEHSDHKPTDKSMPKAAREHGQHSGARSKTDEPSKEEGSKKHEAAAHQHGPPCPEEKPLGPDFERNVQENRQRNMPKMDHSMGHGDDKAKKNDKAQKADDQSGMKHQH